MHFCDSVGVCSAVAPLAGAWIEIGKTVSMSLSFVSLPLRERGLKFQLRSQKSLSGGVAPLAGAWIEIAGPDPSAYKYQSLPLRERGLKWPFP